MSKKKFTPEQMETLRANRFVLGITEKSVTFASAMKGTCIELTDRGLPRRDRCPTTSSYTPTRGVTIPVSHAVGSGD